MEINYLFKGLIIGFSIATPVGPIGILCIHRTLYNGRLYGLLTGLGAATADALYGCVAAFGLTLISNFLIHQQVWFRLVGGLFLCYLGIRTFLRRSVEDVPAAAPGSLLNAYASTFFLTLTNPLTILAFAAIFAGLGLASAQGNYFNSTLIVAGVFLGSASWWLILSSITALFRNRINLTALTWINRLSGCIIIGFGIAALVSVYTFFR